MGVPGAGTSTHHPSVMVGTWGRPGRFVDTEKEDYSIARPPMTAPPTRDGPRANEMITVPSVRLIDAKGKTSAW